MKHKENRFRNDFHNISTTDITFLDVTFFIIPDKRTSSASLRRLEGLDHKSVLHSSRPLLVFYRFTKSLAYQSVQLHLKAKIDELRNRQTSPEPEKMIS